MISKTINLAGTEITLETGHLAKQADGSILIRSGDTVVLATAVATYGDEVDRGFFPLTVEYRDKFYASGKIPGGFFKREARPSDREVISARLTDRTIRPLFPKEFRNEVQVIISTLSYDGENEPDVLGVLAASTALSISNIPWSGPIGCVRIGKIDGKYTINPLSSQLDDSEMDIIVSGSEDSIVMVEGEGDFISEENFLSAIQYAHEAIKDLVQLQKELMADVGNTKREVPDAVANEPLEAAIDKLIEGKIGPLNEPKNKHDRYRDVDEFTKGIVDQLIEEYPEDEKYIRTYVGDAIALDLRQRTLNGVRADGRKSTDIRDINIDLSLLPRAHGSAVFTRGETQALVALTLGGKRDEQMLDNIEGVSYKRFMLHYNFPPFSVGEVRFLRGTSRREVGHGNLAERAIKYVLPSHDDFPYTIRIVSDILESNGSSSMATVCGGVMSLMDAGVPIKAPVAGVAMGLILENEDNHVILSDILGTEDHLGDMDFKVAGSKDGITAIQMDLKIDGLPVELLRQALEQARLGRLHILDKMTETLAEPREKISEHAPKIMRTSIPVDMIATLIGPGGKNIRGLCEKYTCEINVEEDGQVFIYGQSLDLLTECQTEISNYGMVPVVGETYRGVVDRIMDFGAFVNVTPTVSGLVHISEMRWERVRSVEDIVKMGETVEVKLMQIDDMGRYNFSMKALMPKPEGYVERESEPRDRPRSRPGGGGSNPRRSGGNNRPPRRGPRR